MKITMTAAGGKAMVLADDASGATVQDGFRPRQARLWQNQAVFRGAYRTNLARRNLENRLSFTVERVFATREAALNFMAFHADSVPVSGTLTLHHLSPTGQATRTLANAIMLDIECVEHVGVSCKFQYTVAGNGPWA